MMRRPCDVNQLTLNSTSLEIFSGDFPFKSRMAEYALSFLKIINPPVGRCLVQMFASIISKEDLFGIVEKFEQQTCLGSIDVERLRERLSEAEDEDDAGRAFAVFIGAPSSKECRCFLQEAISLLQKGIVKDRFSYRRRLAQLSSKLNLGEEEISLIELGCCYNLNSGLEGLVDSYDMTKKGGLLAFLTGVPRAKIGRLISSKGALASNGFLKVDSRRIEVDDSIFDYLIGNAGTDFAPNAFYPAAKPEMPLRAFDLKEVQIDTLVRLLNAPDSANILFYGKPGTGKTELTKALVRHCGKEAVFVSCGEDGDGRDRKTALLATVNSVSDETVIIVDEVDVLLNTQHIFREARINKGWLNHFLDTSRHKIIWITNDICCVEESVLRRFSYNLYFKQLNWRQRESIWDKQLRKQRIKRFFQTEEIRRLSKEFAVSPGLIAYAVRTVAKCRSAEMSAQVIREVMEEVLTRQMELTEGVRPEKKLHNITANYDLEALNTDFEPQKLISGLDVWQRSESGYGMNLLFWGWPGTGKTEFAKHMAERLGKELLVKRMSDLQSKWLGETEQNIATAFREAEENDAVLFFDEADSLFINRQTAIRSWETSQTNEILTQMENFSGILICCTNLLENLDEAAMRRFAFKVKFLPLTEAGKLRLYRKYFGSIKGTLTPEMESRLSAILHLCPGDIKAVWQRIRFMGDAVIHTEVIQELEKEVSYKQGQARALIGFNK